MSLSKVLRYVFVAGVLVLAGCPQMFVYVPEGAESILPTQTTETSTPGTAAKPIIASASVLGGDAEPVSPPVHSYSTDQIISLTTETEGAVIYYTLDGTDPDPYGADIRVYDPATPIDAARGAGTTLRVRAVALAPQMYPSEVADVEVTIDYDTASTPTISPSALPYPAATPIASDFQVTLTSQDDGEIWYTISSATNPVDPVEGQATRYTTPIAVSGDGQERWIKAIAVVAQKDDSDVGAAHYLIDYEPVAVVTFSPTSGTYSNDISVTLDTNTAGASIWYTTDGSVPVPGVNQYSTPIPIAGHETSLTIRAVATSTQMEDSAVTSSSYLIDYAAVSDVTFSPPGGTYPSDISVTLDTATAGADIWYTTDGSAPVPGVNPYSAPLPVAGHLTSLTIRAVATRSQMVDSAPGSAAYTIEYPPPAIPTGLAIPTATTSSLSVNWDDTPGATNYELYRATNALGPYFAVPGYPGVGSAHLDTGLSPGTLYFYKVLARNAYGLSDLSAAVGRGTLVAQYVYLRGMEPPWGVNTNEAVLDLVLGAGTWNTVIFETAAAATIFQTGTILVYVDGGFTGANECEAFLDANMLLIQSWVSAGGRLFLNAAPNEGNGMSFGFGGVNLVYTLADPSTLASSVAATDLVSPLHPIFEGPYVTGTTFSGGSYSHAEITGGGTSPIITSTAPAGYVVLSEVSWGAGRVLFGGMTTTNFHSPATEALNLRANMVVYLLEP